MKNKTPKEHIEQVTFVNWFRLNYPDTLIFAIPNGGLRDKVVAQKLKAEGVVKGVPDLCIPSLHCYIEMKRASGGRQSAEQKQVAEYLEGCGYTVLLCKGHDDAINQVKELIRRQGK